jgi:hypothetical protein
MEMSDGASACQEGVDLVQGARQDEYGEPGECYRKVGQMWGIMLQVGDIPAATVAMMMVVLKLGREMNKHKRDNLVDMAGYVEIADIANGRR